MPKRRKLSSINGKCRVCLGGDGCMGDIFSEDLRPKINDLAECTSIHINDDDDYPRNICHVCLYKLDMWIDFKKQFVRSNSMLREHLELGELSDNAGSRESLVTQFIYEVSATKRKHNEPHENVDDEKSKAKKIKTEDPNRIDDETEIKKSPTANNESVENEDSSGMKMSDIAATDPNKNSDNTSDVIPMNRSTSPKVKHTLGRRAKTTERREASTKRWVARKKALLAATGENETDTDSISSDDPQLSPVQKARAMSHAETHRRVSKTQQNFDGNHRGTNGDSEKGENPKINPIKIEPKRTNGSDQLNDRIAKDPEDFLPNSVRSELIVDDATFVVTSTLVLSDPRSPSETLNPPSEESNRERNTDIIDAVQLRRVGPKSQEKRDNKFVESCLNIEVEGTELEALQRVQRDLANFVENDMKDKFSLESPLKDNHEVTKESFQSLDQQLRTIVEKAISKNLENTRSISNNRGNKTFTSDFVKAALRSKIFQPRVALFRLDAKRLREIEKKSVEKKSINDPLSITRAKRRHVQPLKYADFDTSPIDSELEESREAEQSKVSSPGPKSSKVKTYGPAAVKQLLPSACNRINKSKISSKLSPLTIENPSKISSETTEISPELPSPIDETIAEKHICGVCGDSFETRREVELHHFSNHKNSGKQTKEKMMRCKRCHEIVEARFVKSHVCRALRSIYKCYSCNSSFKTEKLLASHVASHSIDDRDGKIDLEPKKESKPKARTERLIEEIEMPEANARSNSQLSGSTKDNYTCFVCDKIFTDEEILKDHLQMHCDDMSDDERSNGKDYQCAICSESLESDYALETHVEKHLFDDEDDNPNLISISGINDNEKTSETARCGQCAEEFDSEMLLMLHMQAHDEEVAIAEWERQGIDSGQHICVICDDVFATEIELSDHLDIHNGNAHICQLCDKPFLTLEELQCHVNTH